MSFQTRESLVRLQNTTEDISDVNRAACDCHIDRQTINTVKTQKIQTLSE